MITNNTCFRAGITLVSLTYLCLAWLLYTKMAVSLSTGARIRLKVGSCICALPRASLKESEIQMIDTCRRLFPLIHESHFSLRKPLLGGLLQ